MKEPALVGLATALQRSAKVARRRRGANKGSRRKSARLLDTLVSSSPLLANSTRHSVTSRIERNSCLLRHLIFSTRHLNATLEKRKNAEKFNTRPSLLIRHDFLKLIDAATYNPPKLPAAAVGARDVKATPAHATQYRLTVHVVRHDLTRNTVTG